MKLEGSTPSLGTTQVHDKKRFKETEKKFLPNFCQEYPQGSGIKIREITNKHDGVSYKNWNIQLDTICLLMSYPEATLPYRYIRHSRICMETI